MYNLAIISPNPITNTETFIIAHKNLLAGNIFYFYNGYIPTELDGYGKLMSNIIKKAYYFARYLLHSALKPAQHILKDFFIAKKIQAVLVEFGDVAPYILPICKALKLPMIVHFHGYDAYMYEVLAQNKKHYLDVFEYANDIVVVSQAMKKQVMELGCPESKITVNPCGAQAYFTTLTPNFSQRNFMAVGRLVPKKAPHFTIQAFTKVAEMYPDAKLWIGGKGSLEADCKALIQELGLEKRVTLAGYVTHEQICEQINKSFCFVQHSIRSEDGDSEGMPVVILEAGVAALPVIATQHAGIPDIVIHGETGFLFPEKDIEAMTAYMLQMAENMDLAQNMGKKAQKYILENFSIEKHINNLDNIIKKNIHN